MTSTPLPTDTPPSVTHAMIAAALAALRHMLLAGHVEIRDLWNDFGSGPGAITGRVVAVSVSGHPAARDALLAGMTEREPAYEWEGSHDRYRDWRGYLLMMPVLVSERIERVMPDAAAELPESVDRAMCFGVPEGHSSTCPRPAPHGPHPHDEPAPVPVPDGSELVDRAIALVVDAAQADPDCTCWATSPNGCPVHYVQDADPRPLLELVLDERFGPARGPVAPIEVIGGPGESVEQLAGRFDTSGLIVVPGNQPADGGTVEEAWSRYAKARAFHEFGARRFPTIEDARDAVKYWAGYDMLFPADREAVAAALVDPGLIPMPAVQVGTDRRRFPGLLPRRRNRKDDAEVAV